MLNRAQSDAAGPGRKGEAGQRGRPGQAQPPRRPGAPGGARAAGALILPAARGAGRTRR